MLNLKNIEHIKKVRIDASRMEIIHESKVKTVLKAESGIEICINKVFRVKKPKSSCKQLASAKKSYAKKLEKQKLINKNLEKYKKK